MRVLVIEDDVDLNEALADALRDAGHDVQTAYDGALGWQALHEGGPLPDVILLDIMMPNMDGRLFRIRQLAEPRLASLPTLVMTAATVDAAMREALGPVPVLHKPLKLDALFAAITEITEAGEPGGHALKHCACGRAYDEDAWRALPKVGEIDNGRNVGERLELRNCACDSTLAWQLGMHAISVRVPAMK